MTGEAFASTVEIPGKSAGTPQISADGRFIGCTHNVNGNTGHFTLFDTSVDDPSVPLEPIFTIEDATAKFSPVG